MSCWNFEGFGQIYIKHVGMQIETIMHTVEVSNWLHLFPWSRSKCKCPLESGITRRKERKNRASAVTIWYVCSTMQMQLCFTVMFCVDRRAIKSWSMWRVNLTSFVLALMARTSSQFWRSLEFAFIVSSMTTCCSFSSTRLVCDFLTWSFYWTHICSLFNIVRLCSFMKYCDLTISFRNAVLNSTCQS